MRGNSRRYVEGTAPREGTRKNTDVIVAFARYGVAIETIARALAVPVAAVEAVCRRAISHDEMQIMPPQSPSDARTASLTELVHLRVALSDTQARLQELQEAQTSQRLGFVAVAKLTRSEADLVGTLVKRGRVSKAQMYDAVFGSRLEQDQPEPKIIDVFICKIRKKLTPYGIRIKTIWGAGYEMDAENADKLKRLADTWHEGGRVVPMVASPPMRVSA